MGLIALSSLLLLGVLDGAEWLVRALIDVQNAGYSFGDGGLAVTVTTPAGIGRTLVAPPAAGAAIAVMRDLDRSSDAGIGSALRCVGRRWWRLLLVQLLASVLIILLLITIIGIPYAIKKFIDWQLAGQEILFEDASIIQALRGSSCVVRGHWWHTATTAGALWLISQIPGPAVGFALLFTTTPVYWVNIIGSIVFAFLIPYVAIGRTYLYLDLKTRRSQAPLPAGIAIAPATGAG